MSQFNRGPVYEFGRRNWHSLRGIALSYRDHRRFSKHMAPAGQPLHRGNARALIMYYTHSIEKGLSHTDFRPNFGDRPIAKLSSLMNLWLREGRPIDDTFFQAACGTMQAYMRKHDDLGVSVAEKIALFDTEVREAIVAAGGGGVREMKSSPSSHEKTFSALVRDRVSTREFADGQVEDRLVSEALELAMLSPSACNRQAARVHLMRDPMIIDSVLRVQAGFGGYPRPPMLMLITGEASNYVEATERNQPYIDGSLFAMSLIYALEERGLATCALTAMMWSKNERKVRDLLGISESECLVMFVAIGNRPSRVLVPFSQRERREHIVTVYDNGQAAPLKLSPERS